MIAMLTTCFSILGFPWGMDTVYALMNGKITQASRVELPTYYFLFFVVGIIVIGWGIMKIFRHESHDH